MAGVFHKPKPKPHYAGHRERLRDRFMNGGADALHDYEMLELLLFRALPRQDTKPLAKALLKRFRSFAEVLTANPARLREVKGVGDTVVAELKLVVAASQRMLRGSIHQRELVDSWSDLLNYCRACMAFLETEIFRVLFLDRKNAIIADEVLQEGTVDHTPVYTRDVVKRALELSASSIVLVHNHPSGDTTPSKADIAQTKILMEAAQSMGIHVHDHLIIGRGGFYSMRGMKVI